MLSRSKVLLCLCFFKQKTAYEMRISDWSSDVCSSDLHLLEDQDNPDIFLLETRQTPDPDLVMLARRYPARVLPFVFYALHQPRKLAQSRRFEYDRKSVV